MKKLLNVKNGKFFINDEPFFLLSGDIHYFRIHPSQWRERLRLMCDFGLTAIQTYCPWNLHEPERGVFNFMDMLDLGRFIDIANEEGLYVLLRPSPYICSECDNGGMPYWIKKERDIALRTCDPRFISAFEEYFKEICKIVIGRLSTNGGNIIAVAVENEYGDVAHDFQYLEKMGELLCAQGIDVPLYTTNGSGIESMYYGTFDGALFNGHNFRADVGNAQKAFDVHNTVHPQKPFFIGELWSGRSIHWGEPYHPRDPHIAAESFKEALELGAYVNFYMFSGGTNFGAFSGGIVGKSFSPREGAKSGYIAHTTSYDGDALITEYGVPTEKYYLCRDVLDEFLGKPARAKESVSHKVQSVENIELTQSAYLFDNLDALVTQEANSYMPLYMEDIGQDYGFILYSRHIDGCVKDISGLISLYGLCDRATVYADGEYKGCAMRDQENEPIRITLPTEGTNIDVLVENTARVNTGINLYDDRKGIEKDIRFNYRRLVNWKNRSITLKNIDGIKYGDYEEITDNQPVFLRGVFNAKAGVDTFVNTDGFSWGYVWINGFNLGRYRNIGPQKTLYVPGALLRAENNIIEILDIHPKKSPKSISLIDKHQLIMD